MFNETTQNSDTNYFVENDVWKTIAVFLICIAVFFFFIWLTLGIQGVLVVICSVYITNMIGNIIAGAIDNIDQK